MRKPSHGQIRPKYMVSKPQKKYVEVFEVGKAYEVHDQPIVAHIVGELNTTAHGEKTLVAETITGELVPIVAGTVQKEKWVEIPLSRLYFCWLARYGDNDSLQEKFFAAMKNEREENSALN
jgi:hypothetical protein